MLQQIAPIPGFQKGTNFQFRAREPHPVYNRLAQIISPTGIGIMDFFMRADGNDTNSGTDNSGAGPRYASTNGSFSQVGPVTFTPTDGSIPSNFIKVGDVVSVMVDGATTAQVIALVLGVQSGVNGTITMPASGQPGMVGTSWPATGAGRTLKCGGAFKTFAMHNMTNWSRMGNASTPYRRVRMNIRNDQTYPFVGDYTSPAIEPDITQGYTNLPGDGGKFTMDFGGVNGNNQYLGHQSDMANVWADFIITCNVPNANVEPALVAGTNRIYWRMVIRNARGNAVNGGGSSIFLECEFSNCNLSNQANGGLINWGGGMRFINCYFHDMFLSNGNAIVVTSSGNAQMGSIEGCIFDNIAGTPILFNWSAGADSMGAIRHCDFYRCGNHGINIIGSTQNALVVENCHYIKCGGYFLYNQITTQKPGIIALNNAWGDCVGFSNQLDGILESGTVRYPSFTTPWNDPDNGDFSLVLPQAAPSLGAGRALFSETGGFTGGVSCYVSPVTINHVKVPSTQTNYPVLVAFTDARLKSQLNGGRVANNSGFDISAYADTGLTIPLSYVLVYYDPVNGTVIIRVKIPILSSTVDTVFYLAYGIINQTTNGSSSAALPNILGMWPLGDGTTLNVNSLTGSNNGTNSGATPTSGLLDGAASFAGAQQIACGAGMNPPAITIGGWINGSSFPNAYNSCFMRNVSGSNCAIYVKSNGKMGWFIINAGGQVSQDGTGSNTLLANTWYQIALSYGITNGLKCFVNAGLDVSVAPNGNANTTAAQFTIGNDNVTAGRNWTGKIQNVFCASVETVQDWLTVDYNMITSPSTFATLGTEGTGFVPLAQYGKAGTVSYPDIGATQHREVLSPVSTSEIFLPDGFKFVLYNYAQVMTNAISVSVISGTIPPGLAISNEGASEWIIGGIPTATGNYTFTVRVTSGGQQYDYLMHITINLADTGSGGVGGF